MGWTRVEPTFGMLIGALTCGCGTARGSPAGGTEAGVQAMTEAGIVPSPCPNAALPASTDATECPAQIPDAGSCCGKAGLSCSYPGDETYHSVAVCSAQDNLPLFWGIGVVIDRQACTLNGNVITLGVNAPACATRPSTQCAPDGGASPQDLLNEQLGALANACDIGLLPESVIQVAFTDGCAVSIVDGLVGPASDRTRVIDCLSQALDAAHFACADGLECGGAAGPSTLP